MLLPFLLPHEVRSSWQVGYDMPEELQFMAHIGRVEGFTPPDGTSATHAASTEAEADWRVWWDRMLIDNFTLRFERARAAMPNASFFEQARSMNPKVTLDPPTFDALDAPATVQALCRLHWPTFQAEWDGAGMYGQHWLVGLQQNADMRLDRVKIVYHRVRAAGKRVSAPFRLHIDTVTWPSSYRRHVSDEHVVIGAGYLTPERADEYRALHASYIARLV